jgi:hypothetical protein
VFSILSRLFNRSPATGDRKDPPMPETTPQTPPSPAPDVTAHLTTLADAVRQLAESQKTLLDALKPAPAPAAPAPSVSPAPSPDIGGDPAGGRSPGALTAIDYSKLSPLQQITLGLRDANPSPRVPASGAD